MIQSKKKAKVIYQGLKDAGINFVATVPDTWIKELNAFIAKDPDIKYVCVTREEEGVGIAAGATLGGKKAALTMEITGLGNSLTALGGLNLGRRVPVLILASYRAYIGEMFSYIDNYCARMDAVLQALGIPYYVLSDVNEAKKVIKDCQMTAEAQRTPVALLLTGSILWEE
jgi:sulfopyruvate decarboxylase subunit alpha